MQNDSYAAQARLLANLSNETRLKLLAILIDKEVSVGELAQALGISQSALSQHLARLRTDGLVSTRRDAQTVYYRSDSHAVRRILDVLKEISGKEVSGPSERSN